MNRAAGIHPIEIIVDVAAAAIFAVASAFAASRFGFGELPAALSAFISAFFFLRLVPGGRSGYALPLFDPAPVHSVIDADEEPQELLLTAELMLPPVLDQAGDELLLDDMLIQPGPDSRVVQLFDRDAAPTAGELKARIDRHLRMSESKPALLDASQALSDALAQLRRSLR